MEDNAQALSAQGNGSISQMTKPMSPDIEQLTRDFRTFIADCETLFHNATALSGAGATVARGLRRANGHSSWAKLPSRRENTR